MCIRMCRYPSHTTSQITTYPTTQPFRLQEKTLKIRNYQQGTRKNQVKSQLPKPYNRLKYNHIKKYRKNKKTGIKGNPPSG